MMTLLICQMNIKIVQLSGAAKENLIRLMGMFGDILQIHQSNMSLINSIIQPKLFPRKDIK